MAEILFHSFELDQTSLLKQVIHQLVAEGTPSSGNLWDDGFNLLLRALAKTIDRSVVDNRTA